MGSGQRNSNRWDTNNALLRDGRVLYDKRRHLESVPEMTWIDNGLSATTAAAVADWLPPGRGDLADLLHVLTREGKVAGFEVTRRFYEVGSPSGLLELEAYVSQGAGPSAMAIFSEYHRWL